MASGANNTFRQVGIATGIAVLGAIFQSQIVSHTSALLNQTAVGHAVLHRGGSQLTAAMAAGQVHQVAAQIPLPAARAALLHAYRIGFSSTLNHLMIIAAVIAFVGSIAGFALVRQRDFVVPGGPGGGGAGGGGTVGHGAAGREGEATDGVATGVAVTDESDVAAVAGGHA
jgi:hypothetical protein